MEKRNLKLEAHAEVGYLVGYNSTNIYRIYIPSRKEVRRIRDVTFCETSFFSNDEVKQINPEIPEHVFSPNIQETEAEEIELYHSNLLDYNSCEEKENTSKDLSSISDHRKTHAEQLLTPENTPEPEPNDRYEKEKSDTVSKRPMRSARFFGKYSAFSSNHQELPRNKYHASFQTSFYTKEKFHQKDLPPLPRNWSDLSNHPLGDEFIKAGELEWNLLHERKTFSTSPIPQDQATSRPLPLIWAFAYKFDKKGYLCKVKSRLCVRGDLQPYNDKDTYAATLATRNFRILCGVIAKFDLEARSLDAINAFTNAELDEVIYVHYPEGFKSPGSVLRLAKALYGLRRSPLLWQKELSSTFRSLNLVQSMEEPCIFYSNMLLIFFFVDDIIVLFKGCNKNDAENFIDELKKKYSLTDRGDLSSFLGITITRDRLQKKLWLTQNTYIEKIAHSFNLADDNLVIDCPFPFQPPDILLKNENQASKKDIHHYQSLIGCTNYAAISTRPDIAKYSNSLAEHMQNPSKNHISLAKSLISYLYASRFLSLQFSDNFSDSELSVYSDAAFADDLSTRHSSQGYFIRLFGGPITWSARKQQTVTTSSTEAELLAFTSTAKELISILRLFDDISLQLDITVPEIRCDNKQTIRLITADIPNLKTALKHVDVHKCWARQEYLKGTFNVSYVPSRQMIADGFTKLLPRQKFIQFRQLLQMSDIQNRSSHEACLESDH